MASAIVNHFFSAKERNGQRCIHFITCAVMAMSLEDFGRYPSMPLGRSWHRPIYGRITAS